MPCESDVLFRVILLARAVHHDIDASQLTEEEQKFGFQCRDIFLHNALVVRFWNAEAEHRLLIHETVAEKIAPLRCDHPKRSVGIEAKLQSTRLYPHTIGDLEDTLETNALTREELAQIVRKKICPEGRCRRHA